ncbi:putative ATP-dependent helicase IRC3 [Pseudogymnoascus australis]
MSINSEGHFVPDDNKSGNAFDNQDHMGNQGILDYSFHESQSENLTTQAAAMSGISHPDNFYQGQVSDPRHVSFGQDAGLDSDPIVRPQIGEQLQGHTPTPTPMLDNSNTHNYSDAASFQNQKFHQDNGGVDPNTYVRPQTGGQLQGHTPTPMLDDNNNNNNNNTQNPPYATYSQNQNFQPRQNRAIGPDPSFSSSSDMGRRSRNGRGILPPRLPESTTGVNSNHMGTGNGYMAQYNSQFPTPMQAVGHGRTGATNMAQAGIVGTKFRRSPSSIVPLQYDNQNAFLPEQYLDIQPSNSANTASNGAQPNSFYQQQTEANGWTRDQMHKYGGASTSGYAQGQSSVLENHAASAPDGSDTGEDSDGTIGSLNDQSLPTGRESMTAQGPVRVQGMESSAGGYGTVRSGIRGPRGEPMSSRQFKGHSDRAAHRLGLSQLKVGNPIARKSKGANDPENVEIVNCYDNYRMSFQEIAQLLNRRQQAQGKPGSFTPNSIHNRYNRCAPIMYQAAGKVFVAIKDRKKHAPEEVDAMSNGPYSIEWTQLKDDCLRRIVEEYESKKWSRIAAEFTDATHERVSARTVATRMSSPADALEPVINPPSGIRLRQYQEECIQSVLSYLDKGHKRLGISLATGSGKTVIFTQLIDRVKPLPCGADQTLILAHRQELVEQAAKHCINAYPTKSVDVEMGNIHASGAADITIASVQSIISKDRIEKFNPSRFKLILVDEAHHIVAPGYLKTLAHFGLSTAKKDGPALVGVSATLSRFDGLRLGAAIDQIVYHKDYIDMIGEKWLSDVIFTTVESKADISKVKKGATGDFQTGELSRAVNTDQSNEITVRTWLAKAQERKSTLVFCVDLAHIAGLTKAFRDRGVDARFVTGDTPKIVRSETLDAFRAGEFPVLVNCGVFTEGTDVPNIDCVLLARPTKSRNLLVQMIGRGMRLFPGKENCHIIDMVASLETGIISTPTLFGLDPSELVAEATVDDMKEIKEAKMNQAPIDPEFQTSTPGTSHPIKVTFTDYDSVFDLIEDSSGERHIRAISRYAWVEVSDRKYILTTPSGTYLKIEPNANEKDADPVFVVSEIVPYTGPLKKQPYKHPREIARHSGFEDAVHAADTFASLRYPKPFIVKTQRWREKPATEGQLMFLNRFRLQNDPLTPDMINKGKAGDMITKIKHGARGRFAKVEATRRKLGRQALKLEQEEALKKRENVSVGPLLD